MDENSAELITKDEKDKRSIWEGCKITVDSSYGYISNYGDDYYF